MCLPIYEVGYAKIASEIQPRGVVLRVVWHVVIDTIFRYETTQVAPGSNALRMICTLSYPGAFPARKLDPEGWVSKLGYMSYTAEAPVA